MTITKAFKIVWRTLWVAPVAIVFVIGVYIGLGPRNANKAFKVMADALKKHSGQSS